MDLLETIYYMKNILNVMVKWWNLQGTVCLSNMLQE